MRGSIEILQIALEPAILRKCLTDVANQLVNGTAKSGRVLTFISLKHTQRLVYLHYLLNELIDLLLHNILILAQKLANHATTLFATNTTSSTTSNLIHHNRIIQILIGQAITSL